MEKYETPVNGDPNLVVWNLPSEFVKIFVYSLHAIDRGNIKTY